MILEQKLILVAVFMPFLRCFIYTTVKGISNTVVQQDLHTARLCACLFFFLANTSILAVILPSSLGKKTSAHTQKLHYFILSSCCLKFFSSVTQNHGKRLSDRSQRWDYLGYEIFPVDIVWIFHCELSYFLCILKGRDILLSFGNRASSWLSKVKL